MQAAPFYADVADGPDGGTAWWVKAADGPRVRAGVWNKSAPRGTVLVLPGRAEYVEKYGRTAGDLALRGYATVSVDFRGQGLADRALSDPMIGHVTDFAGFQHDIDAVVGLVDAFDLPEPRYLLAHSMGGCIALRALTRGLRVRAVVFSAPMWGIPLSAGMRQVAHLLANASHWLNLAHKYAPGTSAKTYVLEAPFEGNVLTSDPEMWAYMQRQIAAHRDLALGGPSLGWLRAALAECAALSRLNSPACPMVCALGVGEKVIDPAPIHQRADRWPSGRLDLYPGAKHEVLMETPDARKRFFDAADALFQAHGE